MKQEYKNDLAVSWEKVLSNEEDILNFFKRLELDNYKDVKIISKNFSEDGRLIALIEAHNGNDTYKIIIDATSGIPTWEQFINVTYDDGNDSDVKIILYGKNYDDQSFNLPAGGLYDISNLVRRNNKYGVRTYLVKGIDYNSTGQKILNSCVVEENPEHVDVDANVNFPSKLDVQKAEFWIGYYLPHWCAEPYEDDEDIEELEPGYSLSDGLSTKAFWNDEGLFIELRGELNSSIIEWIWANKKQLFQEVYPDCSIELKSLNDKPSAISIKIVDIPIGELIKMGSRNKWEYGELVYDEEHKFVEVAEKAIDDYREANIESKTSSMA
ncbi:MAG: hypothetical protein BWY27_00012 [Bacteroidetes bacterium ADurb.Bin234]|nr:MAG: hypothetical protein BWY27_00012 [Bacteroidetes bacterium ADurb.Bin234]